MGNQDAKVNNSIFRKNQAIIIASNRHLASILPVRLIYDAAGYVAGVVLAYNSTGNYYQKYVDGSASGVGTAACILFEDHGTDDFDTTNATETTMARGIFGGEVFYAKLTGIDAAGIVDLKARSITDATGTVTLKF